jgi:hypothetical protein
MTNENNYDDYMEKMSRTLHDPVYFWSKHGNCYLGNGITNPSLIQRPREDIRNDGQWKIIPIDIFEGYKQITPFIFRIKVAIIDTTSNMYLSCRRKSLISNSCLAEFRSKQGEFEIFTMRFCFSESGRHYAIFKSHNGYYLHYNETFHTGEFKTCKARNANGLPMKGRWLLFDCSNGIPLMSGEKSTARQITKKITGTAVNLVASVVGLVDLD